MRFRLERLEVLLLLPPALSNLAEEEEGEVGLGSWVEGSTPSEGPVVVMMGLILWCRCDIGLKGGGKESQGCN